MRRGQAWYVDFMVGFLIFVIAISTYYIFQDQLSQNPEAVLDDMIADAKQIASSLMSPGFPEDWDRINVIRIGLLTNDRIDFNKLDEFVDMDYNDTRNIFRTSFQYIIFFYDDNETITLPNNETYIGLKPVDHSHLVKVTRLILYNSTLAQMEVQIWQ